MKTFKKLKSKVAVIAVDNIDTDQIIPSDFLKVTQKEGLGTHLFCDWRYLNNEELNSEFVLNKEETKTAKILVAGDNFGCGSSREHAPWALLDYGIEVVISSSIADIFSNNSIKNGLLPIEVSAKNHQLLLQQNEQSIVVDLEQNEIHVKDQIIPFKIEPFARYCLLNGIDQLDFLRNKMDKIEAYENKIEGVFQ